MVRRLLEKLKPRQRINDILENTMAIVRRTMLLLGERLALEGAALRVG